MESNRFSNSLRNTIFGLVKYLINIILPFVTRTILIYKIGVEYAGISSLFSSILQVLSLSELGFSTAVVFELYEPMAKKDIERIGVLLYFFKDVYRCIGILILFMGLLICPFLNLFIGGTYPDDVNITVVFLILLLNTSISYLFCGYKSVLFSADQRDDVLSKCSIAASVFTFLLQLFSLIVLKNYYAFLICMLGGTIVHNFIMLYFTKKYYSYIYLKGKIAVEERKRLSKSVRKLFGHQLDSVVITSADNIVISVFLGLELVTIYNNYYYIMNSVLSVLIVVSNAFAGSIGNSIAIETKSKNYKNFIDFTYFNGMISSVCTILMFVLYQDFMIIWMGEEMLLGLGIVLCLCISFYVRQFRRTVITYKFAAGIWAKDALKPYVAALVNLVLNILFVKILGICGVVISTIISIALIECPWESMVFFREYFKGGAKKYCIVQIRLLVKTILVGAVVFRVAQCMEVTGVTSFVGKAILLTIVTGGLFFILSYKDDEFRYCTGKVKDLLMKIERK